MAQFLHRFIGGRSSSVQVFYMRNMIFSAAVLGAALIASPSVAATVVGSAAVSMIGTAADTASIDVGTTFTNTNTSIVGSATGDFAAAVGQNLTLSPISAIAGSAFSFVSGFGNFTGTVQSTSSQGAPSNRTVNAFVLGSFTPMGSLSAFMAGPASATFAFTQTGVNQAVSGSFTFASPPAGLVPEPASWAMLITGFGLVGAAARRRRQNAVAA